MSPFFICFSSSGWSRDDLEGGKRVEEEEKLGLCWPKMAVFWNVVGFWKKKTDNKQRMWNKLYGLFIKVH